MKFAASFNGVANLNDAKHTSKGHVFQLGKLEYVISKKRYACNESKSRIDNVLQIVSTISPYVVFTLS